MSDAADLSHGTTAPGSTIAMLARHLVALRAASDRLDRRGDAVGRAAFAIEDEAIQAVRTLISTTPARSLADAAMQVALVHATTDLLANGVDDAVRESARSSIERLSASALLTMIDAAGPDLDPAAIRPFFRLDHWRAICAETV
ncbi:MAG TPA: hypothetical protein VK943_00245 [Arenibaculum sp.]|nr:hypothetical protein [Arenibaculum sp.]